MPNVLAYRFDRSTKNYHVYVLADSPKAPPWYVPTSAMPSPAPTLAVEVPGVGAPPAGL